MAVSPIATPIGKRCSHGAAIEPANGEAGCCSSVAMAAADAMNSARQTASLRYSGQCDSSLLIAAGFDVAAGWRFPSCGAPLKRSGAANIESAEANTE